MTILRRRVTPWHPRMTRKASFVGARVVPDAVVNVKLCQSKTSKVAGSAMQREVPVRLLPVMTIPSPIDRVDATNPLGVIAGDAPSVRSRLVARVRAVSQFAAKLADAIPSVATRAVATVVDRIEVHGRPAVGLTSRQQGRLLGLKRDVRKVLVVTTISSSSMTKMPTVSAAV